MMRGGRLGGLALVLLALACGDGGKRFEARGVVREVVREYDQIVIAHEDIPGLMPAMASPLTKRLAPSIAP